MPELDLDIDIVEESPPAAVPKQSSLGRLLLGGSSALAMATVTERGFGFIANLLAARLGGAQVFGAYSVAMTTANNVASYAGAGIGTTANRFSGEYPYGRSGYRGLLRSLAIVSLASAAFAVAILWFTAGPLAVRLLRNPGLGPLLRFAALSSGSIILLECLRGLLIGQRRFAALFTLCVVSGVGMLAVLPLAAKHGPLPMVVAQAVVALTAILICVAFARKLAFAANEKDGESRGPKPSSIARFGMVQLIGVIGINASGWWIASLVARGDVSLLQMGWYSAAMQMRNMCMMLPMMIAQTSYAQLSDQGGQPYGGPGRVTVVSTFVATLISLLVSGLAAAAMPWLLPLAYGRSFAGGELAATLAIATGLVHMSGAPAAQRLTVVSLPGTGVINGIWALVIIGFGTLLVPAGGAAVATSVFLGAHIVAAVLVLISLFRLRAVPRQLLSVSLPSLAGSVALAVLGWLRFGSVHKAGISALMILATALTVYATLYIGKRSNTLPAEFTLRHCWTQILAWVRARGEYRNPHPESARG